MAVPSPGKRREFVRSALRYILGVVVAYTGIALGVALYGLIALVPTPASWWKSAPELVIVAHQLVAFIPLAVLAGLVLERLLPERKLFASIACTAGAMLLSVAGDPEAISSTGVFVLACLLLVFGLGIPATVWIASFRRARAKCL